MGKSEHDIGMEFEAWVRSVGESVGRDRQGAYSQPFVRANWNAWQAATALAEARVARRCAEIAYECAGGWSDETLTSRIQAAIRAAFPAAFEEK